MFVINLIYKDHFIWQYQKENIRKRVVENAEQTGIVRPLKWAYVRNAVNQNYPTEPGTAVVTIRDGPSFQLRQAKPFRI